MRVAALCSERAPGLRYLLESTGLEIVCCLADTDTESQPRSYTGRCEEEAS